ncbi:MAG: hypothetical protein IJ133_00925 [Clostridia bacterium]|nr:hypothetical protein [Clostridia bacterium]
MKRPLRFLLSLLLTIGLLAALPLFASAAEQAIFIPKTMTLDENRYYSYEYDRPTKRLSIVPHGDLYWYNYRYPFLTSTDANRQNIMILHSLNDALVFPLTDLVRTKELERITTPEGTYTFERNKSGAVTKAILTYQGDTRAFTYTYDRAGRLTKMVEHLSDYDRTYVFSYNLLGRLSSVLLSDLDGEVTTQIKTDSDGRMIWSRTRDTGAGETNIQEYTYNGDGRLLTVSYHESGITNDLGHRSQANSAFDTRGNLVSLSFKEITTAGRIDAEWTMLLTYQQI